MFTFGDELINWNHAVFIYDLSDFKSLPRKVFNNIEGEPTL